MNCFQIAAGMVFDALSPVIKRNIEAFAKKVEAKVNEMAEKAQSRYDEPTKAAEQPAEAPVSEPTVAEPVTATEAEAVVEVSAEAVTEAPVVVVDETPIAERGILNKYWAAIGANDVLPTQMFNATPDNDHWNLLLGSIHLDTETVPHPETFVKSHYELLMEMVNYAQGYLIELSVVMDYALANGMAGTESYFRMHTDVDLNVAIGADLHEKLYDFFDKAENLSFEGNLDRLKVWTRNPLVSGQLTDKYSLNDLAEITASVSEGRGKQCRRIEDSIFWLSKYMKSEAVIFPLAFSADSPSNRVNRLRKAGIRDQRIFDFYGDKLFRTTPANVLSHLAVMSKFIPLPGKQMSAINSACKCK